MNTENLLVESYLASLKDLSYNVKLDLIARLSESLKKPEKVEDIAFKNLYGAFQSEKTAEEQIEEIRQARAFNRNIEEF